MSNTLRVAVMGLGYVGLPLAITAAECGYSVVGFDVDVAKVRMLNNGQSYIEDVGDARLSSAPSFRATSDPNDLAGFDIGIITVPTPLRDRLPDLSHVEQAARILGEYLLPDGIVILESTTYPGTTENLVADIIFRASGGLRPEDDYCLGFSPERIDPGNKIFTFATTPKIVSGTTPRALRRITMFYNDLVVQTVPVSSPKVAEAAKLLENTFRHVNIALVNEFAMLAHDLGIDIWEVVDAAASKPFGFMKFTPGPGVGGHCLPIDPAYLSWAVRKELDKSFRFVELAVEINAHMPEYVVSRAAALLNTNRKSVNGSSILVLGVAYKPGTSDVRESPSERIIELLGNAGARITISDPHVPDWSQTPSVNLEVMPAVVDDFDLVILVTDHVEFDYDKLAQHAALILDCRNRLPSGPNVHKL
jgi:UDP-N-acetyl-D-glucosamine dehydrogenase